MLGLSTTTLTTIYILTGSLVLSGFVLEALRRGGATHNLRYGVAATFLAWIGFLLWRLGGDGLFPNDISSWAFCLALFGFVGAVCGVALLIGPVRKSLLSLPYEILFLPQGLRVFFGAGFLIEGVIGLMPANFSILDGVFHIASGFLALKSGLIYARKENNRGEVWFANLFGLTDIVIVALGIPFVLIAQVGPNHNMMYAAFFAAPLFVLFHLVSIIKLATESRAVEASSHSIARSTQ